MSSSVSRLVDVRPLEQFTALSTATTTVVVSGQLLKGPGHFVFWASTHHDCSVWYK